MRYLLFAIINIYLALPVLSQNNSDWDYSIMFYNVENLFDCKDDTLKNDSEFLDEGYKNWSPYKMYQKINGISKVIFAANQWDTPTLIGLCEVENSFVLKQLIYQTGLNNAGYRFLHYESPDRRGIDVALLYKKDEFEVIESAPVNVSNSENNFYTRDCLYAKGIIKSKDTVHVFVNHWPSKRGGAIASEHKREKVAAVISLKIDSIMQTNNKAKIVAMGDFNAEYESRSLQKIIKENSLSSALTPTDLSVKKVAGSHKYRGQWALIDHILISDHWLNTTKTNHRIVQLPILLEEDKSYSGVKPKRTYAGPRYIGGVSDHLPVIITFN